MCLIKFAGLEMATTLFRIIILDDQFSRRLSIEKSLNSLGYYRIVPLSSINDLINVLKYAVIPFDFLIINRSIINEFDLIIHDLCRNNPYILNALIYDAASSYVAEDLETPNSKIIQEIFSPPNYDVLKDFMCRIENK